MKICPKCGGKRFIVTAHVAENWLVDEEGTFLEATQRGVDVVHYPDDNDVWECEKCGYISSGDGMEMKEYNVTISYTTSRTFTVKARNEDDAIDEAVNNLDIEDSPISYAVFNNGNCIVDGAF